MLDGVINIYKEKGYTSYDVVALVKKILNCSKVGHTGTLDPEAEGILPICLGRATKIAEYLTDEYKYYQAELTFGITTTTEDHTGEIVQQRQVNFNETDITEAVNSFKGECMQIPPMYSAIKVNGQRLYTLAREGRIIERIPRKIEIKDIRVLEFLPPDKIIIDIVCSKGTYIRTLCVDIGEKMGCGGHMSALIRKQISLFKVQNSIKLDELKKYKEENKLDEILFEMDRCLIYFPKIYIKKDISKALYNGNKIYNCGIDTIENLNNRSLQVDDKVLVYDYKKNFVGIYKVFFDENELGIKSVKILTKRSNNSPAS